MQHTGSGKGPTAETMMLVMLHAIFQSISTCKEAATLTVPPFTNPYPAWRRRRCSTNDHNALSGEEEEKDPMVSDVS
jgi:hypothetical protein